MPPGGWFMAVILRSVRVRDHVLFTRMPDAKKGLKCRQNRRSWPLTGRVTCGREVEFGSREAFKMCPDGRADRLIDRRARRRDQRGRDRGKDGEPGAGDRGAVIALRVTCTELDAGCTFVPAGRCGADSGFAAAPGIEVDGEGDVDGVRFGAAGDGEGAGGGNACAAGGGGAAAATASSVCRCSWASRTPRRWTRIATAAATSTTVPVAITADLAWRLRFAAAKCPCVM